MIKRILLAPPFVKHCSQTIYEALLGCIRLYEATGYENWKTEAKYLRDRLINIQKDDGGWDIGYDFNFGKLHKKGESTSPEMVGLVALSKYMQVFGIDTKTLNAAKLAVNWIEKFHIRIDDKRCAIPYGPYSTEEIMVYNGTSFACAGLGCYLGVVKSNDKNLIDIYEGMNFYLEEVMSTDSNLDGKFWFYNDQSRDDLDDFRKNKIDYYHQMQQVEVHSIAQQMMPNSKQLELILNASLHISDLSQRRAVVPYTNHNGYFGGLIHVWGLCSLIGGFLEASKVLSNYDFSNEVDAVKDWLLKYSWNGQFFNSVLFEDGNVKSNIYMVRSDAWVFNALSLYYQEFPNDELYEILIKCFNRMRSCDFSGKESHAQNFRKKVMGQVIKIILKWKK